MARYRKIDVRMWNDRKFRELSDNAKLAFILLLTHPDTTQIGMIRTRVSNLADELGWQRDAMSNAIREVTSNGMIDADEKAGLMVINNFLKYNAPSSPNAFKSWRELIDLMPECDLLDRHVASLKVFVDSLSAGMKNAIPNDLMDAIKDAILRANKQPSRIQEQEQEQEQDIYTHTEAKEEKTTLATDSQGRNIYDLEPNEIVPSELLSDYVTARINSYLPEKKSEEKLPAPEQTEIVETAPASSKPKTEEKTQSRGVASKTQTSVAKPDDVSNELWADFLNHRKQKKAPVTDRVISLIRNEAKNAGWTLEEALNEVILRNWIGFKAEWVEAKDPNAVWVKAEDYQPELPPVEYAPSARECFDRIMAKSTYAYDIKDLSQLERVVKKEAK